ncbi:MAG TPA: UDP-4-amino-4,6-dideoxy-N-acetyl-beta-L-altrosamine transaminase [Acidimicrobiales bacterium]|nr:UDP-4-amino-4,6-dideoxy-N-acetyl-beta-L-altrosamine transaminase [Acidimicrobiales bacterium]
MIPYGRQSIDDDDIAAVVAVLKGDWLTQGPAVAAFEDALAETVGARHAVAFSNGTAALHGAVAAGGLGPGDTVATSPLSFVASANCARFVGAGVTFVDIDPATLNLDPARVGAVDGLVAVHFAGLPVDLGALATRPRVIIEDAAQALGAMTPDGPVGNCARSDMCAFSFHPVKSITTGEGGAVTTNSDELADALRAFRTHGIVKPPNEERWRYEVPTLGFNYRLTDMQAALGTSQLRKLDRFVTRRNALADRYRTLLADLPVEVPPAAPAGWRHAYHLFPIRVDDRRGVYDAMHAADIGVQVHFVPIYQHALYAADGFDPADYPATEAAYARLLSLPLYPDLTEDDQDRVVRTLEEAL